MKYEYNDGGRSLYFRTIRKDYDVIRALSIVKDADYLETLRLCERITKSYLGDGILKRDLKKVMISFGGEWHPCMSAGTGCKVHLRKEELPNGRIICQLTKHYTAVINGVINDTFDPSRNGSRCIYGYWSFDY